MNRKLVFCSVLFTILAIGCAKPAQESSTTANAEFVVDKLFTHEGCTAYRFVDAGERIYYTVCDRGQATNTMRQYHESCGKNCTSTETSETVTNYYGTVQEE